MRGGKRAGAGRKRGSTSVKSRQIVDEASSNGSTLPLAHLLGILNDPKASQARKDRAAEVAASFCHPRLSATATASINAPGAPSSSDNTTVWNIWALPPGCQIGPDDKTVIWPDGTVTDPPELRPYEPTPLLTPLPALTHQPAEPEPVPFEVAELAPPENVANLGAYRRSREEPPDESGAA
jgi:hypothetical protein